ncbi:MAG: hypothetical protein GY841_20030 [FCB group bacterium]|nr:hypothetical protein [FCB group bacterium]
MVIQDGQWYEDFKCSKCSQTRRFSNRLNGITVTCSCGGFINAIFPIMEKAEPRMLKITDPKPKGGLNFTASHFHDDYEDEDSAKNSHGSPLADGTRWGEDE